MTVRSFPFYRTDASASAEESDYYLLHRESGVLAGLDLSFDGLTWSLSPGEAYVAGSMLLVEDTPETGVSAATTGANPRRDMLVARRTLAPGGGSATVLVLVAGSPAAAPSDPALTQVRLGVWEEPLWSWQVPGSGGTTVTAVRDLRRPPAGVASITSMAARPMAGRQLGMRVKPLDRPTLVYVWDGRIWVQEGIASTSLASVPDGAYVTKQEGNSVVRTGNGVGGFNVNLGWAYSAPPLWAAFAAGDNASNLIAAAAVPTNHTTTTIHGQAFSWNGSLGSNALIRVLWTAIGYNT